METSEELVTEKPSTGKRGRPRKVTEAPMSAPVDTGKAEADEKPERKKRASKKSAKLSAPKLARQIQGLHLIAATVVGPEITIDETEAEMLSEAIVNLAEEYDIIPTGKGAAWAGMIAACAMVYGPRIPALIKAVKGMKKPKGQVVQMAHDATTQS